jgi:hypothetical protein
MLVAAVCGAVGGYVAKQYGVLPGIGAGVLAATVCVVVVVELYRRSRRRDARRLKELREKYRAIYRVIAPPAEDNAVIKPEGAEIRVGDYGWEAGPLQKDGLVYLQGLTVAWRVVWHAGFRPDQIEKVGWKPASQYDHWVPYWAKGDSPPPCPFPVLARETPTMGLPHHSHRYFEVSALGK